MSQYKRNNSQYGMRGHIHEERASAAATRKAQAKPATVRLYEPETLAALKLYAQMVSDAYVRGERLPSRDTFVQRVNGILRPTEYACSLAEVSA